MFISREDQYEFLKSAKEVETETWREHISAFIQSFVVQEKRQRWRHLCLEKPEKGSYNAHKMYSDLMESRCQILDYEIRLSLNKRKGRGVFYDFSGRAWWLSPSEAYHAGHGFESIFSIEVGRLAVYFWHENEEFLFQREPRLSPKV